MLLRRRSSGHLIEVEDFTELTDPFAMYVHGCFDGGEGRFEPGELEKADLTFPSGEDLPLCWRDAHYRDAEIERRTAVA